MNAIHFKISEELEKAKKFPPFVSLHEGYAVLKEEVEEFWNEVKKIKYHVSQDELERLEKIEEELIQIAAMAIKNLQLVETMKAAIENDKIFYTVKALENPDSKIAYNCWSITDLLKAVTQKAQENESFVIEFRNEANK